MCRMYADLGTGMRLVTNHQVLARRTIATVGNLGVYRRSCPVRFPAWHVCRERADSPWKTGNSSRVALWLEYAGVSPTDAHTHIDGNVVTCVMVDGVSDFNIATDRTMEGYKPHGVASTLADYKLEAVSEVTRVTHQRVTSFLSSHDPDTDVATETFTLEASLRPRGTPRHERGKRALGPTMAAAASQAESRVATTEPYRDSILA